MLFINEEVAKKMFDDLDESDAEAVKYALEVDDSEMDKPLTFQQFYTYLHNTFSNSVADEIGCIIETYEDMQHPLIKAMYE